MKIDNLSVRVTYITKEVGNRIFTFAVVRTAEHKGKETSVSIGVSSRSPEDQDNFRKDKAGNILKDKNGNPLTLPPDLGNQIALGKALKNPNFAFRMAYGPKEKQNLVFAMANSFIESFIASPESFVVGIRYGESKLKPAATNKLEPITVGDLERIIVAGKKMMEAKANQNTVETSGPVQ